MTTRIGKTNNWTRKITIIYVRVGLLKNSISVFLLYFYFSKFKPSLYIDDGRNSPIDPLRTRGASKLHVRFYLKLFYYTFAQTIMIHVSLTTFFHFSFFFFPGTNYKYLAYFRFRVWRRYSFYYNLFFLLRIQFAFGKCFPNWSRHTLNDADFHSNDLCWFSDYRTKTESIRTVSRQN